MTPLPVIVGFGGISPAGRSSAHHGYRLLVEEVLSEQVRHDTYASLATLMGLDEDVDRASQIQAHTKVRRIESHLFDVDAILWNKRLVAHSAESPLTFTTQSKQLPARLPDGWHVTPIDETHVRVESDQGMAVLLPTTLEGAVKAAGQLPTGFEPGKLYPARSHPRGLQMTVYGASDALASCGLDWDMLQKKVAPDQISVYAGSGMSQLDAQGNGGMVKARYNGKRVTSKYCPFGFAEMPADFINAYVLGSLGTTGTNMGACASFLYNLRQGINDIRSGRSRIAIVGNSEAPITPEIIEGYAAMGALATDNELRELDGLASDVEPDHTRACRPFAENRGFTIAESAQFMVLFDDALAVQMGANVHGAVSDVFVNADGHKKSISAPGVGNYLTVAKALANARAIVGEERLQRGGFVQAHGTGTPQNRVTESHILNECARAFGIESWPVGAVKAYLGHSIGTAAGDQVMATLGAWAYGWLPGIHTMDAVAEDVHDSNLLFSREHVELHRDDMSYAIINAKGFGGNNASATLLSPTVVTDMLTRRHGKAAMHKWNREVETAREAASAYDSQATAGTAEPVYKFDHEVLGPEDISLNSHSLNIPRRGIHLDLDMSNPYDDMS